MVGYPDVLVFYITISGALCQTSEYDEKCFGLGLNITDDQEEQLDFFDEGMYGVWYKIDKTKY